MKTPPIPPSVEDSVLSILRACVVVDERHNLDVTEDCFERLRGVFAPAPALPPAHTDALTIYRRALERIAGNEADVNREKADGIAIGALEEVRQFVPPAQGISPAAMAVLTPERIRGYGGIGKLLDAALLALPSVERAMGVREAKP